MAESEQIWWIYVKLENIAEIYSAWIDSSGYIQAGTNAGVVHHFARTSCKLQRKSSYLYRKVDSIVN